ncbi:hypothetical protein [Cognatiyoonia sp. IB215182]|uniref:hypothetical protein n=1 Tax=Cognatiyoonia sp. IB215182 TaxID=3097353 RepID=UPI002A163068|nr:hypothetical protein [Cognatiyoonia sp. IB215182]MDX8352740.1 hypothetical protein [Cognatiyoonia sp. IB215182]
MRRFAVIRVPTSGPPALVAQPNVFDSQDSADARIAEIEARQLMTHHTYLDTVAFEGPLMAAMQSRGISV